MENLITQSPYSPTKPTIFYLDYKRSHYANLKLNPHIHTREALATIEGIFSKYDPENPFEYQFVDEAYAQKFGEEERVGKLAGAFTVLAILISCLGLFGLSSFVAEKRTKEIGIRKVLGASVVDLWRLLSKDFAMLVLIASAIAIPLAYYGAYTWLQNFEYQTELSLWVFAAAILGALSITLLTVSYQAIRVALANPIHALRTE